MFDDDEFISLPLAGTFVFVFSQSDIGASRPCECLQFSEDLIRTYEVRPDSCMQTLICDLYALWIKHVKVVQFDRPLFCSLRRAPLAIVTWRTWLWFLSRLFKLRNRPAL